MHFNNNLAEYEIEIENIIPFPFKIKLECPDCRGSGLVTAFAGRISGQHKCLRCEGSGKIRAK
jgi:DnaJ-class molecular chaperone